MSGNAGASTAAVTRRLASTASLLWGTDGLGATRFAERGDWRVQWRGGGC
jgi:hypothetical protein